MYHISSFRIEGFWGSKIVECDLKPHINIFIGRNGSGKTTLMNLLSSVLQVDFRALADHDFTSIEVRLADGTHKRKLRVEKILSQQKGYDTIKYRVGSRRFDLELSPRNLEARRYVSHSLSALNQFHQRCLEVRTAMAQLVKVSSVTVHRQAFRKDEDDEDARSRLAGAKPPIDRRLDQITDKLTRYQLQLAERASVVSTEFQHKILLSVLYMKDFDRFDVKSAQQAAVSEALLTTAYQQLNYFDDSVRKRIKEHVKVLSRCISDLKELDKQDKVSIDTIMPLPLIKRTQQIVDLSLDAQSKKNDIFKNLNLFFSILHEFIDDKKIGLSSEGLLNVVLKPQGKSAEELAAADPATIEIGDLSSGEKQLMVLLAETLLQEEVPFIFLADEPELSLHIRWQEQILDAIHRLNPSAQIIVATHAPEITSQHGDAIIDMEKIFQGKMTS
ncbi:MAG TPA: AAA family ATPase [bacterium]